ncbi:hypothetical protein L1787_02715 [Acuticoccus sp. M5D2P5]|uniref:hypothetical protein n=1 Tax=Acuticoccus kalidii TaxID=2910977 RepID=UPI001F3FDE4A|nr:hypothetical protein [Acuticoccus kalidii]MCF3932325.1 hypothetical protein [Acuticoccus kalidii]
MARSNPSKDPNKGMPSEEDLAGDIMGRNALQGDDQESVRNERQVMPDAKLTPDADPVESAKLTDKDVRAKAELGKGNRYSTDKKAKEAKR